MAFDPSTAKEVSGFDPTTAVPIEQASHGVSGSWAGNTTEDNQMLGNPFMRLLMGANQAAESIPGYSKYLEDPQVRELTANMEPPKGLMQQVPQAIGQGATNLAMMAPAVEAVAGAPMLKAGAPMLQNIVNNPILRQAVGIGGFEGGKTALNGGSLKDTGISAGIGAGTGLAFGAGGVAASAMTRAAATPIARAMSEYAPQIIGTANKIGTAAGQAGVSALMAPSGEKMASAITAGGLGVLNPSEGPTQEKVINDNAKVYRDVLNPGKGDIKTVEVKNNRDLNDSFKLAAKEGLVIKKTPDNKLDTHEARATLDVRQKALNDQLTEALKSEPSKQFDLEGLKWMAKSGLRNYVKNDLDFESGVNHIDDYVNAAIRQNDRYVDGATLNDIKQGMWNASYDNSKPNSNTAARQVGFAAKDLIEKSYPDKNIQALNKQWGDYLTLDKLLENAHGRVVQRGKIGRYGAQGAGLLVGSHIPIPGATMAGGFLGGKVSDFMNNPERITKGIGQQVQNAGLSQPKQSSGIGKAIAPLATAGAIGLGSMFNPLNAQAATQKPTPIQLSNTDRKKLVDTIYAEVGSGKPDELKAVTSVFLNKANKDGIDAALKLSSAYNKSSNQYVKARDGKLNGYEKSIYHRNKDIIESMVKDPSQLSPYTNFENVKQFGEPKWAKGIKDYKDIGRQRFYKINK